MKFEIVRNSSQKRLYDNCDQGGPETMTQSKCNRTAFNNWYNQPFTEQLMSKSLQYEVKKLSRVDKKLWDLLNLESVSSRGSFEQPLFTEISFSNGQAMELLGDSCQKSLTQLKLDLSGSHGPVSDQSIHETMCSNSCLQSDKLRNLAMNASKCSCLELSTQRNKISYSMQGDWCRLNSGMILCKELERCGEKDCHLDDFNCLRLQYNEKNVFGKGYGGECGFGIKTDVHVISLLVFIISSIIFLI